MKYYNPLAPKEGVSTSSTKPAIESVSSFNIEDPNTCPKCKSATVSTNLRSGERVMFCTNCRVSMAIPL